MESMGRTSLKLHRDGLRSTELTFFSFRGGKILSTFVGKYGQYIFLCSNFLL